MLNVAAFGSGLDHHDRNEFLEYTFNISAYPRRSFNPFFKMMFLPVTPNHVKLVNACYPTAPLAAAPQFQPNSQELSRLTYYAANRPGKLHKLSDELEKRARNHARRAQTGNAKARALLLVTLDILRALTTECRRDLTLFSSGVVMSVDVALSCLPRDLEVVARAASAFTAWATYTDGTLLGVDKELTQTYLNVLRTFSMMSVWDSEKGDDEFRSRTRLVGLAALSSAIQSDALFNSMSIFSEEVSIIVTALLRIITAADIATLNTEATAVETYSSNAAPSPYMAEFQPQRPVAQRRAPSIHVHVDGEKGPSFADVVGASLRAFQTLVAHSNAVQVPTLLEAIFTAFDGILPCGWGNLDLCRWLVSKVTDWTQYQYRYCIPTQLLQHLTQAKDAPEPAPLHFALITMIASVFTSSTPLINLSTSDILSNLVNIMVARLVINPDDGLLRDLVECVSSLGTHIYYADQLQDLAEEIVARLVNIQLNGLLGRGRVANDKGREAGMRCLVACLEGLLRVADETHPTPPKAILRRSGEQYKRGEGSQISADMVEPSSPPKDGINGDGRIASPDAHKNRRNKVAPEVWQDTLALLCEAEYAVRSDYALALVRFVRNEVPKEPYAVGAEKDKPEGSSRTRRLVPEQANVAFGSDATVRFLHALHASVYTLAIAPNLGLVSNAPSASSSSSLAGLSPSPINIIPPTPNGTPQQETPARVDPAPSNSSEMSKSDAPRRSTPPVVARPRQASLGLSLLDLPTPDTSLTSTAPATLSDYSHLLKILVAVHENLPARSLLTGVPMLLALDAAVGGAVEGDDEVNLHKRKVVREVVASRFSGSSALPRTDSDTASILSHTPKDPIAFSAVPYTPVDSSLLTCTHLIDPHLAINALSENPSIQKATGLDASALKIRLSTPWSAEKAVKDSIDAGPCHDNTSRTDGTTHFLKISPALMHIDNQSLASLARTTRDVGVEQLRDALEGRASMSNTNLGSTAHSISTDGDHRSHHGHKDIGLNRLAVATAAQKRRKASKSTPGDVADVLNKLGIGKQNPSKMLRAPFQGGPKQQQDGSTILVPPYSA
ncbi:plasma membrane localization protein [Tulasnella sp. 403]|nr:plasma membrane localization protein [Tulasnella sp. 403]